FDVERDAALAGVVVPEVEAALGMRILAGVRADAARRTAFGRLDLDDVRAHVGEQFAAPLAVLIGEFDDADAVERALAHHSTCCSSRQRISSSVIFSSSPKT